MPIRQICLGWVGRRKNKANNKGNDRYFSFEEICPLWTLAISQGFATNHDLDIQDAKSCIVGEAHGFRNRCLICSKCWEYSQGFTLCLCGNKMHRYIITDLEKFEELKSNFVNHFNERHICKRSYQKKIVKQLLRGSILLHYELRRVGFFCSSMISGPRVRLWCLLAQKSGYRILDVRDMIDDHLV
jgi:hypothetical protein